MPLKDRFVRVMLVLIAGLLAAILLKGLSLPAAAAQGTAQAPQAVRLQGNCGVMTMATSADGKTVYAAGGSCIIRSLDSGAPGSWQLVVLRD